jgi:hypothetical protein
MLALAATAAAPKIGVAPTTSSPDLRVRIEMSARSLANFDVQSRDYVDRVAADLAASGLSCHDLDDACWSKFAVNAGLDVVIAGALDDRGGRVTLHAVGTHGSALATASGDLGDVDALVHSLFAPDAAHSSTSVSSASVTPAATGGPSSSSSSSPSSSSSSLPPSSTPASKSASGASGANGAASGATTGAVSSSSPAQSSSSPSSASSTSAAPDASQGAPAASTGSHSMAWGIAALSSAGVAAACGVGVGVLEVNAENNIASWEKGGNVDGGKQKVFDAVEIGLSLGAALAGLAAAGTGAVALATWE